MFGLKSQASHCLWQLCTHWTHKKPCTWSQWTLPFASESCPAARSTLLGTCPRDLPLENVLPARIYFKLIQGLKLSVLYCLNFTFVTVLPALARPRKSPNEVEPFWPEESKELCDARGWVDCACIYYKLYSPGWERAPQRREPLPACLDPSQIPPTFAGPSPWF